MTSPLAETTTTEDPAILELEEARLRQAEARDVGLARLANPATYLEREVITRPSSDGRIIELRCALEFCSEVGEGISQAAALLGWSHEVVVLGNTQDSVEMAWALLAEETPTMVITSASAPAWSGTQVFSDMGIPVLEYGAAIDSPHDGVAVVSFGPSEYYRRGVLMADLAVLSGDIPPEIQLLSVESQPLLAVLEQGFLEELDRICFEECSLTIVTLSIEELLLGAALSEVVAAGESSPAPLLVLPLDSLLYGVDEVLRGSSEAQLKVVTQGAGALLSSLSGTGLEAVSVGVGSQALGWHLVDQGIRLSTGLDATPVPTEELAGQTVTISLVPWGVLTDGELLPGAVFSPSPNVEEYFSEIWAIAPS